MAAPRAQSICEQQLPKKTLRTLQILEDLSANNTYLNQVRYNHVKFNY